MEDGAKCRLQRNIIGGQTSKHYYSLQWCAYSLPLSMMAGGWPESSSFWVCLRVSEHSESCAQNQGGEERVRLCGDHGLSGGYVNAATCHVSP